MTFPHFFFLLVLPVVTLSSSGGAKIAGENYTLNCRVTGIGTLIPTYQWLRNGSALSGQTSAVLSFSPLRQSDSGIHSCMTTTGSVSVRSANEIIHIEGKAMALH